MTTPQRSLRDHSRTNWKTGEEGKVSHHDIQLGCLQRTADALELIAKDKSDVLAERDNAVREKRAAEEQLSSRDRTIRALKGHITRLKNKLD